MTPRYGATPEEWEFWAHTLGLQRELLPTVCNPNAKISPKSILTSGAKVPSRYTREREIVGIPKWNEGHCLDSDLTAWSREPDFGICLQMRMIQCFDVDVTDLELVAWIDAILAPYHMPRRFRSNSAKCLYLFKPVVPSKKRVLKLGDVGMIEMLGLGNQCLVAGQHPSGVRYEWDQPFPTIPVLEEAQVAEILEALKQTVGIKGKEWSRGAAVPKNILDPDRLKRRKAERVALAAKAAAEAKAVVESASLTINGVSIPLLPDGSAVLTHAVPMPAINAELAEMEAKLAALDAEIARDEAYTAMGPDPVVEYLNEQGQVKGEGDGGLLYVTCPFELNHGKAQADMTQTVYFPAGTGGYLRGHVKCLDGSCGAYVDRDFLDAWGWTLADGMRGFVDEPFTKEELQRKTGRHSQRAPYQLLTIADLAKRPPTSWCIKGVLPQTGLASIYGPSGSGKSFLVIDLAMALASGVLWFKLRTKKCPVVYCALEGEGGVAQRVAAYRAEHGHVGEDVRFVLQPFNLLLQSDMEALAKAIADTGCGGGVTILDTLNRAAPGTDENDSKDMGRIIAAAKALQVRVGGLVILVHHTGKDATKGLRGHSSLLAALDCAIELSRAGDVRSWCIAKSKDGLDGNAHYFRLDVVQLGEDKDGDLITSCVISPDLDSGSNLFKVKIPKGGNQKIVWQAIRELMQVTMPSESEDWPKSAPTGHPCIKLEDAVVKTRDRLTCKPDQRTRSTRTAITGLVNSGLFELKEGWLWEP